MSLSEGTFLMVETPLAKMQAHKIGSEEFFPPEISTSPLRGIPPWIKNFSIQLLSLSSIVIAFMDNA